ncbi:hypothetical protein LDBUL1632_00696 [Lactobacillus delbrueckii subsp. bulgaricus CNCM I-1632]|nr:hypothetical protein LDBUL1632_00696 [Lactobacillus delbrueckii subsp. bulgaricus CNCM I-1632]
MNATMAKTLIAANQNSLSAKALTEKKLLKKINIIQVKLQIQTET